MPSSSEPPIQRIAVEASSGSARKVKNWLPGSGREIVTVFATGSPDLPTKTSPHWYRGCGHWQKKLPVNVPSPDASFYHLTGLVTETKLFYLEEYDSYAAIANQAASSGTTCAKHTGKRQPRTLNYDSRRRDAWHAAG